MKILVSSTTTSRPPLITLDTLAVIASLLLNASSSLLLPLSATSFLYVRRTCPSPSLSLSTFAFISSPTETTVVKSIPGVDEYSLLVIIPSCL